MNVPNFLIDIIYDFVEINWQQVLIISVAISIVLILIYSAI